MLGAMVERPLLSAIIGPLSGLFTPEIRLVWSFIVTRWESGLQIVVKL